MQQEVKRKIIQKYQAKDGDTGSPIVQIAILTKRIQDLSAHLKSHPKDNDSKRGLIGMVAARRRHLNYLKKKNLDKYEEISTQLSL